MPAHLLKFYGDGEVHVGKSIQQMGKKVLYHPSVSVVHRIPESRLTLRSIKSKFITTGFTRSFALLRQLNKPYDLPGSEEFLEMAMRYLPSPDEAPNDLIKTIQNSLEQGVTQHLKKFEEDENFRKWVLHDNYLQLDECYVHPELVGKPVSDGVVDWRSGK